jgi:hypothetical protein
MGFLKRRREARQQEALVRSLAGSLTQADDIDVAEARPFLRHDQGTPDLELRALVEAFFAQEPTAAFRILTEFFETSPEEFYSDVLLHEQWDEQPREVREDRLVKDIRFANSLDSADYDDPRALRMHAAIKAKVTVLALGLDALYETDYTEQLALDPRRFGVHEMSKE